MPADNSKHSTTDYTVHHSYVTNSNLINIAEVYHGNGEKPGRKFAEVQGVQLHYFAFRQDRYHFIAPDLRGHGDSDKPQTGYRLRDFTEDIRQLINLNLRRPAYIGHSRDGTSAQSSRPTTDVKFPAPFLNIRSTGACCTLS